MQILFKAKVSGFTYVNKSGKTVVVPEYERNTVVSPETERRNTLIVELYKDGKSCPEIAKLIGIDTSSAWKIVSASGHQRTHQEAMALRMKKYPNLSEQRGKAGVFHSQKNGKWIPTGSRYEYIRMNQLENDPDVLSFDRCGDRIPYDFNGKIHFYIPDLMVKYKDGTVIIEEIKPDHQIAMDVNQIKAAAAQKFYAERNIDFRFITQTDIGLDYIKNFDWSGFAAISETDLAAERREKERKRQREAKRALELKLTEEQKELRRQSQRDYYRKKIGTMTDEERAKKNKKNAEAAARYRSRKMTKSIPLIFAASSFNLALI